MSTSAGTLHFVGIGGIGMSAIARVLLARGQSVSGSDVADSPILDELRSLGAKIAVGHDAQNVNGARAIVVSSAIDPHNPEYQHAAERGIPIVRRGEMLRRIMEGRRGIAVCGTHGKTTTTAMTAALLRGCGVDASLVLGGIDVNTGTNAHDGSAPWFLTEADESDGSFSLLEPAIAVVTNIENDHLSSDAELPKLIASFARFLARLPEDGVAVVGVDNPQSASIARSKRAARTVTFGIAQDADVRAANIRFADLGSTFDVIVGGVCLGNVQLNVPGAINIENALAALAVGRAVGLPFVRIAAALATFRGVRRRFEILAKTPRMIVVDDYAHHPTAVRATITAARQYHRGPIVVAFQPHRFTRTAYLAAAFADALRGADTVYLAPVYAASEPPIEGVSERSIGEPLRAAGTPVRYVNYVHDLRALLQREAPPNALVLMLGAGNITKVAADLARDVLQPAA
jgi:UDP-N-acetylmuramate--alanine ligase